MAYSMTSILRPGHLRLVEFEIILDFHLLSLSKLGDKSGRLIETFAENFRPGRLIEQSA